MKGMALFRSRQLGSPARIPFQFHIKLNSLNKCSSNGAEVQKSSHARCSSVPPRLPPTTHTDIVLPTATWTRAHPPSTWPRFLATNISRLGRCASMGAHPRHRSAPPTLTTLLQQAARYKLINDSTHACARAAPHTMFGAQNYAAPRQKASRQASPAALLAQKECCSRSSLLLPAAAGPAPTRATKGSCVWVEGET